ncbi:predicted protein [Naegleria gruberi]|uniref:Predicted protein n=1 Tax=Naegleria gruberi TaxID=5762 RepID=D2V6N9_NAEGR|nr:uncharacterized protein NAEGRDRAFT_64508 [Naegleria gruberi]EFC47611.1 predicted protein [Naegleria gruberi]|eukprot:XP_002680355.1 predicted protein [Naegleria gruberi strain NEG-M]
MKTKFIISLCIALAFAALVLANPSKPEPAKNVDTYGEHQQFCYKKCTHYKTVQGKCSDYEWIGTKKECCDWKLVGKGKCLKYKRFSKCDKYSKSRNLCLGHGYKQVCDKHKTEKYCIKSTWKNLCEHKGKNNACDEYAYHFVCTKYDKSNVCAKFINVPKVGYHYKKRCAEYKLDAYCSAYKKVCKCQKGWKKVNGKHYKGWTDTYYHAFCQQKCHKICAKYTKTKKCVRYNKVKFSLKKGYTKRCVKFIDRKFCVAQKKARFCTKWSQNQFCDFKKRVRVCEKFKERKFCANYKAVNFCTQYHQTKSRCIKKKHWKKCVKKSPGYKVCAKYQFVGGHKKCVKYGEESVCAKKKKVCSPIKVDKYVPEKKKEHKKKN